VNSGIAKVFVTRRIFFVPLYGVLDLKDTKIIKSLKLGMTAAGINFPEIRTVVKNALPGFNMKAFPEILKIQFLILNWPDYKLQLMST